MSAATESLEDRRQLDELQDAITRAPHKVKEIEVGIALSIALGRLRPSVTCGGCQDPLAYQGIPARTNTSLRVPFRLVFDEGSST